MTSEQIKTKAMATIPCLRNIQWILNPLASFVAPKKHQNHVPIGLACGSDWLMWVFRVSQRDMSHSHFISELVPLARFVQVVVGSIRPARANVPPFFFLFPGRLFPKLLEHVPTVPLSDLTVPLHVPPNVPTRPAPPQRSNSSLVLFGGFSNFCATISQREF
jgi:hypothetical protein